MKKLFLWMLLSSVAALIACDDDANNEPSVGATEVRVTCDLTIALPSAAATEGRISYEVLYPIGTVVATAEVKPVGDDDGSWLTPSWSTEGTLKTNSQGLPVYAASITYAAAANHGPARSAELVIDYAGIAGCTLTVRQPEGQPEIGEGSDDTLCAGWPELPSTVEQKDWYYTFHITDVKNAQGNMARNYAVCYDRSKMCPVWVAAPMHDFYIQPNTTRTDAFKSDPNFDFTQIVKYDFSTTNLARGHMVASAERYVSKLANQQTFYHSNIAPQLQNQFNSGAWSNLETWAQNQWKGKTDTLYTVIGCYWDPARTPQDVNGTKVPTHYYKVLLRTKNHQNKWVESCSREELQCVAALIEHKKYATNPPTRELLISVAELERKTGLTFFANVPNAPKDTFDAADWGL